MTTLVQTTNTAPLTLTLPLAHAITKKSNGDTISVPVWRKKSSNSAAPNVDEIATDKFERYYKDIQIEPLQQPAQDGLKILAVQFQERFFADKNITNRDLIALKADPSANIKRVLVDKMLIARADRAYNEMYWTMERELGKGKSPNKQKKKKKKSWRSAARPAGSAPSLLERMQLPPDSDDDSDDVSSSDSDDGLGEMPKLESLRDSKKLEAYYGDNGLFDVLALWSDQLDEQPVHALMAQRTFIDLPSESISETVFSIHENFASDLRRTLRPKYIAAMVRNNQNHHLLL